ncbi:hypothetical protein N5J53_04950 [Empedobacter sp. GD03644]|uniref:hypothetical protein n=1 Tax=Empedobacter sp. GD03644 TaxID=2975358 RepID=UPI002446AE5A|nr:hypothetical protein [Empedobacter sp. GD03644]MDH2206332.1 hypothetical protein [Empedobacter sp. GD03644]
MEKTKILFVVGGLHRAGAERFAYEIDAALDKMKFDVEIFCLEKKDDIPTSFNERYYEAKHLELGTKVTYADKFINADYLNRLRLINKIKNRLFRREVNFWNDNLYSFLDKFDVIHWMGEYTYIHSVSKLIQSKSLIHMMSSRFQNEKLYENYNKEEFYRFCTPFKDDEIEFELYQFKNYKYLHIPLVLDTSNKRRTWNYVQNEVKKIGIFTRLNIYKPLDPFFYSYQLLLDKLPNVELHIFGAGNPEQEGMYNILNRLALKDKVFFRGHQEDITKTVIEEKLSLAWFQGYNNDRPAGYAGIDICTIGLPLICWDFHQKPYKPINEIYPHYKNLNQFVDKTSDILQNQNNAESLSIKQYEDVIVKHSVKSYIKKLEEEYLLISKQ